MSEKYARLYHRFRKEFPAVYADDHLLAWWMRLLDVADATWPMHPPLPRGISGRVLTRLVREELVFTDNGTYTVRGLDAERGRLRNAAAVGAAVRWQSDGNATAMPTRPDQTRPTIPPPPAERGRRNDETNPRAQGTAPRQTGSAPRQNGASPRQERERVKRDPTPIHEILRRSMEVGRDS